jgi:hypothetical protein
VDTSDIIALLGAGLSVIGSFIAIRSSNSASKQADHAEEQADAAINQADEAKRSADAAWEQIKISQRESQVADLAKVNEALGQYIQAGRQYLTHFSEATGHWADDKEKAVWRG